tara:strand:+ start:688 stop:840 length:153 start_codon:yes stop_codon:yes gene_type:complete
MAKWKTARISKLTLNINGTGKFSGKLIEEIKITPKGKRVASYRWEKKRRK